MCEICFFVLFLFMYNDQGILYAFSPYTLLTKSTCIKAERLDMQPETILYDLHSPYYGALLTSNSSLPSSGNPVLLAGLTLNDYVCLTPALSWLYPAHTGQVSSFPEAQWSLEASEANGTVSQYSICLTRPWLTGARLNSRGPPIPSKLNPNYLLL